MSLKKPIYTPGEVISSGYVLVRTRSAGLWHGLLSSLEDTTGVLTDVRNIWRWRGANTINELATNGLESSKGGYSRVSTPVPLKLLTEVIDVTPCTDKATNSIKECGWAI